MSDSPFTPVAPKTAPNRKVKKKDAPALAEKQIDTLRGRLKDAADQIPQLDVLISLVAEACKPTRKFQLMGQECVKCGHHCNHSRWIEIYDPKNQMEVLKFVMEQVEGRPGTAEANTQQVLITRVVVGVDE